VTVISVVRFRKSTATMYLKSGSNIFKVPQRNDKFAAGIKDESNTLRR
jgi:hypothetical protein